MPWSKGQPWRVVKSLDTLNGQIRNHAPRAIPPATPVTAWGSIADAAHGASSDHYPKYYSALGATAVVCARDFPHAPALGLDAHAIAEQLRRSRDPRIRYIISDGRITGPAYGWVWESYSGSDPHRTHIHVSSARDARADDTSPWRIAAPTSDQLREPQMQMLIKASDDPQVWLCDGMFRRRISAAQMAGVSNGQTHQAGMLGNLSYGGNVYTTGPTVALDVWGVDVDALGQTPQAAPVDAATLAAALQEPAVREVLVDAAEEGSNRAEDSA